MAALVKAQPGVAQSLVQESHPARGNMDRLTYDKTEPLNLLGRSEPQAR